VHADVANEEGVERMMAFAKERFGGLDILVNNAANETEPPFFPAAPWTAGGGLLRSACSG
jgi:NAD(P)-dependent dehydrogenase (short-subunit alcohol dehydrogenase family)